MKQKGQAIIIAVFFFTLISASVVFTFAFPIIKEVREVRNLRESKQAIAIADSLVEDVVYRLNNKLSVSPVETLSVGNSFATTTIVNVPPDRKTLTTENSTNDIVRSNFVELILGSGAAFNFGIQSGEGGITMSQSSSVFGNAYSNGPIVATNDNEIFGDVISAGPTGLVDGVHATTAYAHTITDSVLVDKAFCQNGSGNTIGNPTESLCPDATVVDQPLSNLPIEDSQIDNWKTEAEAGGIYSGSCPYIIDTTVTIGPVKIPCDLQITKSSADVTLAGNVWVEGNFITDVGSPNIIVDSSLGSKSVVVVADNPANRMTSSKIELRNSVEFHGSGTSGSYILLISQNESAENGGTETAIGITQSAEGDFLLYAGHGDISISQSSTMKEVTGYSITLSQTATVIYESGLASLLFSAGPGGGFEIDKWYEVD